MLASLATCDPDFPIAEWDTVLFQIGLALNMLRCSRVNPKISVWAYSYGNYDFNKNPLAPIGTRVLIHLEADVRASWQNHGKDGWYIGPSMEHYRCVKCYVPTTGRERDADTISYFSKKVKFPKTTTEDHLRQAASDIVFILQNKLSIVPSLDFGDETENALLHISTLLGRAAKPPGAQRVLPTMVPQPVYPPRLQLPTHPLRMQLPIHPPRMQIPTHSLRMQIPTHSPRVQTPTIHPPRVQVSPNAPRVQYTLRGCKSQYILQECNPHHCCLRDCLLLYNRTSCMLHHQLFSTEEKHF